MLELFLVVESNGFFVFVRNNDVIRWNDKDISVTRSSQLGCSSKVAS